MKRLPPPSGRRRFLLGWGGGCRLNKGVGMEFKDYYKTLGVDRSANGEEIRKAFRDLARKYHPDVARNKRQAEEKFKQINEAYEVLGDPEKRRQYDELGAHWRPPGGFARPGSRGGRGASSSRGRQPFDFNFGGTGFSEFFERFFGSRQHPSDDASFGSRPGAPAPERGGDIEGSLLVTLDEVLHGSVRKISYDYTHPETGRDETGACRVRIPPGIQDGQLIRVAGHGESGLGGGQPGDLLLRVKIAKHPEFEVRGADLYHDLPLAPWEAVLGATIAVPALDGQVSIRIPPGAAQGQQLRIRGYGLPAAGGHRGDLFAVLQIQTPSPVSPEEEALWRQLARTSQFKPR